MGNMKDIGLLDCEDRPSIEENFKRVQGGGGKIKPEQLPEGYPYKETVTVVEPLEIVWDHIPDDVEKIVIDESDNIFGTIYKISDAVMTIEQIKKVSWSYIKNDGTYNFSGSMEEDWDKWDDDLGINYVEKYPKAILHNPIYLYFILEDNTTLWEGGEWELTFPTAGIYLGQDWSRKGVFTVTAPEARFVKNVTHTMAEEFLPEGIGGGDMLSVAIVYDGSSYSCNKTYNEVFDALSNNIPIFATYCNRDGNVEQLPFGTVSYASYSESIAFRETARYNELALYPDNTISLIQPE